MRNIAYHLGGDDNPAARSLIVKFQPPGLGTHDSISFSKSVLSGSAPITNDQLCKAKIIYIFSDGFATTSNFGRCPAASLPLIASSWRPDPHVAPQFIKTNVLLAQSTTGHARHPTPLTPTNAGTWRFRTPIQTRKGDNWGQPATMAPSPVPSEAM
jgi:hypothetical protein